MTRRSRCRNSKLLYSFRLAGTGIGVYMSCNVSEDNVRRPSWIKRSIDQMRISSCSCYTVHIMPDVPF